ncbi:MAG: hypothetical protein AMXMBFR7_18140 [Planctomycetota bacterium]
MAVIVRFPLLPLLVLSGVVLAGSPEDEWKVKREQVFDFETPPSLERDGDRVTITFTARGFCDATVAVEGPDGRILRHLACGVLGPNAPEPFAKNSRVQKLVWDGKDERGRYVEVADQCRIRVSLGLKAQFERALLSEPKRRMGAGLGVGVSPSINLPVPLLAAGPEGVLVFEGHGLDHLRLFDHDGNYLRTIYPFPAGKTDQVLGVGRAVFPSDGADLPFKNGFLRGTLLTSGASGQRNSYYGCMFGAGATAMAVQDRRIALTHYRLNRLATDGTSGGLPLTGPDVGKDYRAHGSNRGKNDMNLQAFPNSVAFSPDGKYLYLAGYQIRDGVPGRNLNKECLQGVLRLEYGSDKPPELFAGNMDPGVKTGTDNNSFKDPVSVAVDKEGRVYIADFGNDRIQVYDTSAKHLKSIKASKPARIFVHPKTGELYVFSWLLMTEAVAGKDKLSVAKPTLVRMGSFQNPEVKQKLELPFKPTAGWQPMDLWGGLEHQVAVDFWAAKPRIWVCSSSIAYWMPGTGEPGGSLGADKQGSEPWDRKNVQIYEEKDGKLAQVADFGADVRKTLPRSDPPFFWRQRLYVNPATGKLYIGEGNRTRWYKAFHQLIELDPADGSSRIVELPFSAEDAAFDLEGFLYLRTNTAVTRWELSSMREVPFDYGEEKKGIGFAPDAGGKKGDAQGALALMAPPYVSHWHNGGLWVSPKGHVVVPCLINKEESLDPEFLGTPGDVVANRNQVQSASSTPLYCPPLFPGRKRCGEVHVYDQKGKLLYEDAIPGIRKLFAIAMDRDDNLYLLSHGARVLSDGKTFNPRTATLMKVKPGVSRTLNDHQGGGKYPNPPIPLKDEDKPKRPHDVRNGLTGEWLVNGEWMYGGLIFSGKGDTDTGGGCSCWNGRFTLDLFGRSFAPETDHYSIAVLDSNGNLLLRIGQYGNRDSAGPKSALPLGGDEVGLFHAQYVGVDTDRRLFVADGGNARLLSVKLDYHQTAILPLKR